MAGQGFKDFTVGEVLTSADVDGYLMQQSVMLFADSSARGSALGTAVGTAVPLAEGMLSYLADTDTVEVYDGSAWTAVGGVPVGSIIYVGGTAAPDGYLKADGAAISRTTYSSLFAAIGTAFGSGDGSTTFDLPDLRGEFVRGWDDGRGVDSGRVLGSTQADASLHVDATRKTSDDGNASGGTIPTNGSYGGEVATSNDFGARPWGSGGGGIDFKMNNSETRPRNIAFLACIKYQ